MTDAYLHPRLEGDDEVAKLVAVAVAQGASLEIALALVNTGFIAGHRNGRCDERQAEIEFWKED